MIKCPEEYYAKQYKPDKSWNRIFWIEIVFMEILSNFFTTLFIEA